MDRKWEKHQKLKCIFLVLMFISEIIANATVDTAARQIISFKERNKNPIGIITTGSGRPVEYMEATSTLNNDLLQNDYFLETLTHINRERIPERIVHAKGAGAFGFFEVTHDMSDICKAKLFNRIGKRTPVAVRLSHVKVDKGGIDTLREPRGLSIKFYTEEGNLDLLCLNFPVFMFNDPLNFPSLVHSIKRNPKTNLFDPNMYWDMFTVYPETLHIVLYMFSDQGIPDGFRHIPGFPMHTYQVTNDGGESFFIRFQFSPDAGIKNIFTDEAMRLAAVEPDYAIKDLYNAIAEGNFPSWTCYIQVLTLKDVQNAEFDVFDVTRTLPEDKYPLRSLGRMVLNRNPSNYFAEVEQIGFCPNNVVPGILGAPDKLFSARRFSYKDAQNYRLGGNFFNIPVNCPLNRRNRHTYLRDGEPPVDDNQRDVPNYFPNAFNGPVPYRDKNATKLIRIQQGPAYNLDQCRQFYNSRSADEKERMFNNIVGSVRPVASFLQNRVISRFSTVNAKLGERLRLALRVNRTDL